MFFGSSNYAFNDPVGLNDPSGADPWWEFGPNGASRLETTTDRWQRTGDAYMAFRGRSLSVRGSMDLQNSQMYADAAAVRNGQMGLDEYGQRHGQSYTLERRWRWMEVDPDPFDENGATLERVREWFLKEAQHAQQGGSCCGAAFAGVAIPLGGAGAGAGLLAEAFPPIAAAIGTAIVLDAAETAAANRTFITYTKRHPNGSVYVGRASGWGNAFTVLNNRDRNHHMNALGYGPAVLDRSLQGFKGTPGMGFGTAAAAYSAIRGREQQLIDFYGGVGSPLVGNSIRGVAVYNPLGRVYHEAANVAFGQAAPYTGF